MNVAKIYLNNGETLTIKEGDTIYGIRSKQIDIKHVMNENEKRLFLEFPKSASINHLKIYSHHNAGLTPNLVELFDNYSFFQFEENAYTTYSCSAVTKIELV